jgi:hypothetical protein
MSEGGDSKGLNRIAKIGYLVRVDSRLVRVDNRYHDK